MNHDEHRTRQGVILNKTLEILKGNASVLGVTLAGSYTKSQEDAFSDIDLACYLKDQELSGRETLYQAVANIAPLLCDMWLWSVHALYLFENGVRLDLDFLPPSALERPSPTGQPKILHDPYGTLLFHAAEMQPKIQEYAKPTESPEWFFWMFRQLVCWAKRGEQGDIRDYTKLDGAVDSITQVRSTLVKMRLWTLGHQDYLRRADPTMAACLGKTYPHLNAVEIIQCARLLLGEYERICPDYCRKANLVYPAEKVKSMRRLIDEFEAIK